jgi:hypothetical protein
MVRLEEEGAIVLHEPSTSIRDPHTGMVAVNHFIPAIDTQFEVLSTRVVVLFEVAIPGKRLTGCQGQKHPDHNPMESAVAVQRDLQLSG